MNNETENKKILSPEDVKRREIGRRRCLWGLVIFNLVLVVYIVYQVIRLIVGY